MSQKRVYFFGAGEAEGRGDQKELLRDGPIHGILLVSHWSRSRKLKVMLPH